MGSRIVAIGQHCGILRAVLVSDGLECLLALGLWLDFVAGSADFGAVCTAVHHPARLRAWFVFFEPASQSLGRRLPGPDYLVPLRVLEEDPRRAPRDLGKPRSARVRRYSHPHGSRVSETLRVGPLSLSLLSQHAGVARAGPSVSVPDQASTADRLAAIVAQGVVQCAAQRFDACDRRSRLRLTVGLARASTGAASRGGHSRRAGRLAVLRPAHFPGCILDTPGILELQSGRGCRQLAL